MTSSSNEPRRGTPPAVLRRYQQYFEEGARTSMTLHDAFFVGLYLGEGTKTSAALNSGHWVMTNSDPLVHRQAIIWAAKFDVRDFRLHVQVPLRDPKTDEEIAVHWSESLGLPREAIRVYRKRLVQKTVPSTFGFGTAHLIARKGNTRPWHIWRGQLSQLAALPTHNR
jgi:hypothetical protein